MGLPDEHIWLQSKIRLKINHWRLSPEPPELAGFYVDSVDRVAFGAPGRWDSQATAALSVGLFAQTSPGAASGPSLVQGPTLCQNVGQPLGSFAVSFPVRAMDGEAPQPPMQSGSGPLAAAPSRCARSRRDAFRFDSEE